MLVQLLVVFLRQNLLKFNGVITTICILSSVSSRQNCAINTQMKRSRSKFINRKCRPVSLKDEKLVTEAALPRWTA